jgi:hypothetical protein
MWHRDVSFTSSYLRIHPSKTDLFNSLSSSHTTAGMILSHGEISSLPTTSKSLPLCPLCFTHLTRPPSSSSCRSEVSDTNLKTTKHIQKSLLDFINTPCLETKMIGIVLIRQRSLGRNIGLMISIIGLRRGV